MVKVFYHCPCSDGVCAAAACPLDAQYIPFRAGGPVNFNEIEVNDVVYFLDCSPQRVDLQKLCGICEQIIIIDHHATKTWENVPADNLKVVWDGAKSGAKLTWEYFHQDYCPVLIDYVQDRDLWQWRLKKSREINAEIGTWDMEIDLWRAKLEYFNIAEAATSGASVLRLIDKQVERAVRRSKRGNLFGYEIAHVNCATNVSEVGGALASLSADGIGLVYHISDDVWKYSIRSLEVDVAELAEKYDGGGHINAAGFVSNTLIV